MHTARVSTAVMENPLSFQSSRSPSRRSFNIRAVDDLPGAGVLARVLRCWVLRCWVLGAGCWVLGARCSVLRCSVLGAVVLGQRAQTLGWVTTVVRRICRGGPMCPPRKSFEQ